MMRARVQSKLLPLAMVCLVAAACGGSADDHSGAAATTTTASQACADAAALKASVAQLDQLDPAQAGKAGIQDALDKVQANLAPLRGSATGQWGGQVTELESALKALRTTIAVVDGNSLLSAVPTIVSDVKRIDAAWTALQQQIDQDCSWPEPVVRSSRARRGPGRASADPRRSPARRQTQEATLPAGVGGRLARGHQPPAERLGLL
jgi:hypothetical protein